MPLPTADRARLAAGLLCTLLLSPGARGGPLPGLAVEVGEPPRPPGAVARLGSPRFRHAGAVHSLRYSADGKRLVTDSYRGIYVWDAASGRRLLRLPPVAGADAWPLGFGPAGELVLARCPHEEEDRSALVRLDVASGRVLGTTRPPGRRYYLLTPGPPRVVSRTAAGDVVVDDLGTGRELWRRRLSGDRFLRAADDGSRLALWPNDATPVIEVVETATGKPAGRFAAPRDQAPAWSPNGVAFSRGGWWFVATHGPHGHFNAWKADSPKPYAAGATMDRCRAVVFTPDGRRALFVSYDGCQVWDVAAGKRRRAFPTVGCTGWSAVALSPDGKTLATAGSHCGLLFWDVATGRRLARSTDPAGDATHLHFLAGGRLLARFSRGGWFVWDPTTGARARLSDPPPGAPAGTWSPDRSARAVAGGGQIKLLDARGKLVRTVAADGKVESLDVGPGGRWLLASAGDRLLVWGGMAARAYALPRLPERTSPAVTPDGRRLAVFLQAEGGTTVTVRDLATGRVVRTFRTTAGVQWAVFSPDGRRFLAYRVDPEETDDIEGDDYLGLYNAGTGKLIRRVPAAQPSNKALYRFAPDGRAYAVGDPAGRVAVYDTNSGKERGRFQHAGAVEALAWRPDGRALAAASGDAPVYLWAVPGH
jgi:WD40 repeat protein